jgi:hypothetical protein
MKKIIIVSIFATLGISANANAEYTEQTEETHSSQTTRTQGSSRVPPPPTTIIREVPGPVQVIKETAPAPAPAPALLPRRT